MGEGFVVMQSNYVDIYYYQDEPGELMHTPTQSHTRTHPITAGKWETHSVLNCLHLLTLKHYLLDVRLVIIYNYKTDGYIDNYKADIII